MSTASAQRIAMLGAMGVTVYSTTPRVSVAKSHPACAVTALVPPFNPAPEQAAVAPAPVARAVPVLAKRPASVQRELVLPQAELKRFLESRMYRHLCLLFAPGEELAVVENAVLSDTALHFESPPAAPVKLGSIALLKTNWRKRREAWLAVRLWRKQLKARV